MHPSSLAAVKALRRAKPLFCPLKTEYYEAFERGEKHSELRRVIAKTQVVRALDLPVRHRNAILALYGNLDLQIIEIFVEKPLLLL